AWCRRPVGRGLCVYGGLDPVAAGSSACPLRRARPAGSPPRGLAFERDMARLSLSGVSAQCANRVCRDSESCKLNPCSAQLHRMHPSVLKLLGANEALGAIFPAILGGIARDA